MGEGMGEGKNQKRTKKKNDRLKQCWLLESTNLPPMSSSCKPGKEGRNKNFAGKNDVMYILIFCKERVCGASFVRR